RRWPTCWLPTECCGRKCSSVSASAWPTSGPSRSPLASGRTSRSFSAPRVGRWLWRRREGRGRMKLLVIRGDLQSHSGYSAAARAYCDLFAECFDRIVGVDIHYSPDRPFERFRYPLLSEADARRLVGDASPALVLSFTTPDCYVRYPGAINVGLTFWETDRLPFAGQERSAWVDQANAQDALWVPSTHTRAVFAEAGVTVPITVLPWPIRAPRPSGAGLPEGAVYDLDRAPWLADSLVRCARFQGNRFRWSRRLMQRIRP